MKYTVKYILKYTVCILMDGLVKLPTSIEETYLPRFSGNSEADTS